VCAKIRTVNANNVEVTQNGEEKLIPYDYLVVALGTKYPNQIFSLSNNNCIFFENQMYQYFKAEAQTLPQRGDELLEFSQRLRAANRVLVIGGRTVGTEFIGEVCIFSLRQL
jgi:NADH dehydrogenase FAD-containing subunit